MNKKNIKDNNLPLVSVIIPTYNYVQYLPEAIDSVLGQSYQDFEIIVIDDGSIDNTKQVLNSYIETGKIRYFYQKNKGPSAARNVGIKNAKGNYITFLDADDIWEKEKIFEQVKLFESNEHLGLVCCNATIINKYNNIIDEIKVSKELIGNGLIEMLKRCFIISPSLVMVKKNVLEEVGVNDESLWYSDWELYIRILKRYKLDFVNKSLVKYRLHDQNLAKNVDMKNKYTLKKLNKIWQDPLIKKYSQIRKEVYSKEMYDLGLNNLEIFQVKEARKCFFVALQYNLFDFKCFAALLKSFLPTTIYFNLKRLKKWVKR